MFKIRVIEKIRIDVKENWHIDFFIWIQTLLFEAKALDFVEILKKES